VKKIDKDFNSLKDSINDILSDSNQLIWLQILLPKSYQVKEVLEYTYSIESIEDKRSKKFIEKFVYGCQKEDKRNKKAIRSLHFFAFPKSYHYKEIKCSKRLIKLSLDYKLSEPIKAIGKDQLHEVQLTKFKEASNLKEYWKYWCDGLEEFVGTSSTLWSYTKIPEDNSAEKILSYYAVFNEPIKGKLERSGINKKFQEFLISHGFEMFNKKLKKTAIQSSLSAVASRNQSHNIGSHVLNNLSNPEQIKKFLDDKGYKNLYKCSDNEPHKEKRYHLVGKCKDNMLSNYISKDDVKPEQLIAHFNTYLKARMDFIADVGTSVQSSLMNTSNLFDEVFAYFEKNLILLREISGKEDEFQYGFNLHYNNDKDKKGPQVAMPNGLLGQQAFYIIIENIIRNTAKHESIPEDKKVCFTIDANSNTEGLKKDFCEITIYSNLIKKKKILKLLLGKRNGSINRPVLDPDNTVRKGGWGTIEMKLSAAYLCGINLLEIDNEAYNVTGDYNENNFPILEAVSKEVAGKEYFGYRFYIRKPKLALIVFEENNTNKIKELNNKEGIAAVFKKHESLENEIFNHDFLIYVGNDFNEAEWNSKKNLPQRVIHYKLEDEILDINEETIWKKYYDFYLNTLFSSELKKQDKYFKFREEKYYFDRHGNRFPKFKNKSEYKYIEPFGTSTLLGHFLNNTSFRNSLLKFHQCVEAVDAKIIIIDERVQSARSYSYQNDDGCKILFEEIYEKTGIIVPDSNCISLIKTELKSIKGYKAVKKFILDNIEGVSYLVLHYGIVEVLDEFSPCGNFLVEIEKLIFEKLYNKIKIVIVSGRGQTKDIPKEYYFINHSTFSYFVANQFGRSKLHLTQLLKSSRSIN
jgi:hypothetical protein